MKQAISITDVIGDFPYRIQMAGGWIDQPFVSRLNPKPPGSMVVVSLQPDFFMMDRAGMATGSRHIALKMWNGRLPQGNPAKLVEDLYAEENRGKAEPSGTQDMPVLQRPDGYNPLGIKHLDPESVAKLSRSGRDCYAAIVSKDVRKLGASLNLNMECWEKMLPQTVSHPTIKMDLVALLHYYQSKYPGVMFSGCGGGYLLVASDEPVPGSFRVNVRTNQHSLD